MPHADGLQHPQQPPSDLSGHPARIRPVASKASSWTLSSTPSRHRLAVLTGTEIEVARAVADGLPNREVAARLFVSSKTIEHHLTRIYRKLGARSRTDLVRLLLTADDAPSDDTEQAS